MIKYASCSVHTLELMAEVKCNEVNSVYCTMKNTGCSIKKDVSSSSTLSSYYYTFSRMGEDYQGINSVTLIANKDEYTSCIVNSFVHIIINPAKAYTSLSWAPNADIIPLESLYDAYEKCLLALRKLLGNEIVDRMKFNRIDFCCNIAFERQAEAEEYISLLQKGIPPKALKKIAVFAETAETGEKVCTGILLTCGSYEISIYLKQKEMLGRKIKPSDLEEANGVLRIELRALSSKLHSIIKKEPELDLQCVQPEQLVRITRLGLFELKKKISHMTGEGRFLRYDEAVTQIKSAPIKAKYKDDMFDVLYYLARHPKGGNLLKDRMWEMHQWKKLVHLFDKIDCSPVVLPRTSLEYHYPSVAQIITREIIRLSRIIRGPQNDVHDC